MKEKYLYDVETQVITNLDERTCGLINKHSSKSAKVYKKGDSMQWMSFWRAVMKWVTSVPTSDEKEKKESGKREKKGEEGEGEDEGVGKVAGVGEERGGEEGEDKESEKGDEEESEKGDEEESEKGEEGEDEESEKGDEKESEKGDEKESEKGDEEESEKVELSPSLEKFLKEFGKKGVVYDTAAKVTQFFEAKADDAADGNAIVLADELQNALNVPFKTCNKDVLLWAVSQCVKCI